MIFSQTENISGPKTLHSDSEHLEMGILVTGYSLIRSLARSHHPLVRLLRTRRSTRALRCAHSLAPELVRQWSISIQFSKSPQSLCSGPKTLILSLCSAREPDGKTERRKTSVTSVKPNSIFLSQFFFLACSAPYTLSVTI